MKKINPDIIQFFSTLADETRLNILISLMKEPKTVGDIHKSMRNKLSLSAVSHQLRQLTDIGILNYTKEGRNKYFSLSDDFCWCILSDAFDHFEGKCRRHNCNKKRKQIIDKIR